MKLKYKEFLNAFQFCQKYFSAYCIVFIWKPKHLVNMFVKSLSSISLALALLNKFQYFQKRFCTQFIKYFLGYRCNHSILQNLQVIFENKYLWPHFIKYFLGHSAILGRGGGLVSNQATIESSDGLLWNFSGQ